MAGAGSRSRFVQNPQYVGIALKTPDMRDMIKKKMALANALYIQRVKKRSGLNARSRETKIFLGGEKHPGDRWEGELATTAKPEADYGVTREFGRVDERGGHYRKEVAERYGRDTFGRATQRSSKAEHVLGGDNRRRTSIVATLEKT